MADNRVYYLHSLYMGDGSLLLTQLKNVRPSNNYSDLSEKAPSQVAPQFTGSHQAVPDIRFDCCQADTLITAAIAGSFNVAVDLTADKMYSEYRHGVAFGTRALKTALNHFYGAMNYNAMLTIEKIRGRQGDLLEVQCRLVAVQTASDDPLVFTDLVAITAVATVGNYWTIGPIKLNGAFIGGVTEWELDNGIEYEEVAADGDQFLSYVAVKSIKPRLTFRTRHTDNMAGWTNKGTALSALSLFIRKKLKSNINVADATAQHIKLAATEGTIKAQNVSGDDTLSEVTVDLHKGAEDTAPYAWTVGSAIS